MPPREPSPSLDRLSTFASPYAVQAFLDETPYSTEPVYRCPASVLRDRKAHCFDGAVFAAAVLKRLGHRPRILEMLPEPGRDDTHVIALFQGEGGWGAVAKSNFVGLRYREPIHRTLRELVMTYFEAFYNVERERTLRGYTVPLDLTAFDHQRWEEDDATMEAIANRLDRIRRMPLLTPEVAAALEPLDRRSYDAGMLGLDRDGLWMPPGEKK